MVKRGKRLSTQYLTIHFLPSEIPRFAIVVSKAVGNAVQRNIVKRRARSAAFASIKNISPQISAVLRMRPESAEASWDDLSSSIDSLITKATN